VDFLQARLILELRLLGKREAVMEALDVAAMSLLLLLRLRYRCNIGGTDVRVLLFGMCWFKLHSPLEHK
jgi:hypothetical protein